MHTGNTSKGLHSKDWTNIQSVFENVQLYKRISLEYFPSCAVAGDLLFSDYEKDYNRQTTPHISYMYTYTHTRLQNKITNIIETNKLHKTNSLVSSPSVSVM